MLNNSSLLEKLNSAFAICFSILGMVFIGGGYLIYLCFKYYFINLPDSYLFRLKLFFKQKSNNNQVSYYTPMNAIKHECNK